jgi:hypothetical protein
VICPDSFSNSKICRPFCHSGHLITSNTQTMFFDTQNEQFYLI